MIYHFLSVPVNTTSPLDNVLRLDRKGQHHVMYALDYFDDDNTLIVHIVIIISLQCEESSHNLSREKR